MTTVCVGVDSKGNVEVDIDDDDEGWDFHVLSLDKASFLHEELGYALERARARKAVLDARIAPPPPAPPPPPEPPKDMP